ncbi:MAG TPA: response regulator [bacterium]|nr:response regulator [bacterium]
MADRRKALVIDDEPLVCRSVKKILAIEEIDTDIATSGREGLVMARNSKYDMLLVDVKMPEMNGYAVVRMMREIQPTLPIIVISGYNTPHTREQAFTSGANEFVPKPFLPEEIRDVALKLLKGMGTDKAKADASAESGSGSDSAPGSASKRDAKSAIGYACVNQSGSHDALSAEEQKKLICRFADSSGMTISSVYEDTEAGVQAIKRPALLRILDTETTPGTVIVGEICCVGKNRRELRDTLEALDAAGMKLVSASEKMDHLSQFVRMWYEDREAARREEAEESKDSGGAAAAPPDV